MLELKVRGLILKISWILYIYNVFKHYIFKYKLKYKWWSNIIVYYKLCDYLSPVCKI